MKLLFTYYFPERFFSNPNNLEQLTIYSSEEKKTQTHPDLKNDLKERKKILKKTILNKGIIIWDDTEE